MATIEINNNIKKSAKEMQALILRSKRKLHEIETLMSVSEIARGKAERFDDVGSLLKSLK